MITKTAAAVLLTVVAGTAGAATVQNGSFEDIGGASLNRSGWNLFTAIPNWTADYRVEVQSDKTIRAVDAQDGSNYVELVTNRNDSLSQDIFLSVGTYQLSFFFSPRVKGDDTTSNDMSYSVGTQESTLTAGMVRGAPDPDHPWGEWSQIRSVFSVEDAGIYTLSFAAVGASNARGCGSCGALIDNVTLTTMPLPTASLLLLAGLGGLGAFRALPKKRGG